MSEWPANAAALAALGLPALLAALAAIWRAAAWNAKPAQALIHDNGLPVGAVAPGLAGHAGDDDVDTAFIGGYSFVVFGDDRCVPCQMLVEAASKHPATRWMRLVYASKSGVLPGAPHFASRWEAIRLHNEDRAREQWNAPVTPYFHVIDERGRIRAKGIANRPEHLDRIFMVLPSRRAEIEATLLEGAL